MVGTKLVFVDHPNQLKWDQIFWAIDSGFWYSILLPVKVLKSLIYNLYDACFSFFFWKKYLFNFFKKVASVNTNTIEKENEIKQKNKRKEKERKKKKNFQMN